MTTATVGKWIRVTRRNRCPVCGKPDWCLISQDGKAAICARIESGKPVGNKGAGWLHTLDNSNTLPPLKPKHLVRESPKAALDVLNTAYRALLTELPLSETHRANLQHRGLTGYEIHALGYKSYSVNGRQAVVQRLTAQGIKLTGVPGFWLDSNEIKLSGPAGIAIPVRDTRGRIVGLQIRCDSTENGSRYKWLSSRGCFAGCSPGTPVHVAGPVSTNGEVWITEGPLKADIVALRLGRVVLAVPGVGNWPGVIPIVRDLTPARVIVAFDMDKLTNHAVQLHRDALMTYLIKRGVRAFEAEWNQEYKGLDDLLATGDQPCRK